MKKLEDIPKKQLFEVPEGYFDRLPGLIQARVSRQEKQSVGQPYLRYGLKYALPTFAIAVVTLFLWTGPTTQSAEEVLASISSEQLVAYLQETDLNADDFLDAVPLDQLEVEALQENVIQEMNFDDIDFDEFVKEFDGAYN